MDKLIRGAANIPAKNVDWKHRAQFLAMCAVMMRRILVDRARARGSRGRGPDMVRVDVEHLSGNRETSLVVLHEALEAFSQVAPTG
jgi:hypothetical protein